MRVHVMLLLQVPNNIVPLFRFWMRTHVNVGVHVGIVVQITILILLHASVCVANPLSQDVPIHYKGLTASRVNVSVLKFLFLFVQEHDFQ